MRIVSCFSLFNQEVASSRWEDCSSAFEDRFKRDERIKLKYFFEEPDIEVSHRASEFFDTTLFNAISITYSSHYNPFLDVCNTLLDPGLPTTIKSDREEFGNPKIRSHFLSIFSYSPYDNIPTGIYCPAMLVTASFKDSRVGVRESAKWVAKVRENACSDCSKAVILETNMKCGHLGEPGRLTQFEKYAYRYAFMMKAMGLMNTPHAI